MEETTQETRQQRHDRFVGYAIQGLLAKYGWSGASTKLVVDKAIEVADAALAKLEGRNG